MRPELLDGFRVAVQEKNLGVYGVHIYREGEGCLQYQFRSEERVHLFSGSKTFTSLAVGMAIEEGRFALDTPAIDFFPSLRNNREEGNEKITVRDLLQMRAGHASSLFSTDEDSHERKKDWAECFFWQPVFAPAGTVFLYNNGCSYMLSRIVEAASGQTLRDYLMPRLFNPLGIFNPQWHTCPGGHSLGAIGLYLKTSEFALLGRLLLQNGAWEGQQLVPAGYLRQAVEDTVQTQGFEDEECRQGYGYQMWRCSLPGAFRADGKYGQYSVVLPNRRAVVTITAHNEAATYDILRAIWNELLPRME